MYNNTSLIGNKRKVRCKGDGLPNTLTFSRVEHKSYFNEHIRYIEVSSDGIATLPPVDAFDRYQDTGLYVCNASNNIPNREGNTFQQGEAYLVSDGPPVFVADNKNLQYGEMGKPMNISVKVYSTSEINCLHLNAIGSLNIKDIFKKSVPLTMSFHGVNITANGIEVTFRVAKLQSFQWFNITVCNNYSMNNFILEVRQTAKISSEEKEISSEGIGIIVLLILVVILLVVMGIYLRYIKQRYRKRKITTTNVQTANEDVHYIEIVEDNNGHGQNNQMISTEARSIVEQRNPSLMSGERHLAFQNNDRDTLDQSIATSDNDSHTPEHVDDGYERPYTTLLAHNFAEDEHFYNNKTHNSLNETSTPFPIVACKPIVGITEQDASQDKKTTHFCADDGQVNNMRKTGEYINLSLKQ
ncbi:uncharacterized protein LOC143059530 [Mytilus galloprovincialis]|uniref:uncharacterized protein LOC143059530 n=1 Tax=Mytilus galloprovincialis TaxID=29158 RepID=UPI003F7BB12D